MGQLPELRAHAICHVKVSLDTSGVFSQHWQLQLGPQQDFERIRPLSRAHGTNTRRKFTGIIITFFDMDQSRIPLSLLLCHLLRHSSERCCTCYIPCIGTGWSGPAPSLLSIDYLGGSKSCIYTRSAASRQRNGRMKYQPFLSFDCFIMSSHRKRPTQRW